MTLQEALEKVKQNQFLEEDLFNYFKVKNIDGLEAALGQRFIKAEINNDYVVSSFKFIYQQRAKKEYNPLEENYLMIAMILKAFYNMESEELKLIAEGIGLFKTVYILTKLLEEKEEVIYFKQLYKQYIERYEAIGIVMKESFDDLNEFLISKTKDMKIEDVKGLQSQFETTVKKIMGE
jgi:hypothetical protein